MKNNRNLNLLFSLFFQIKKKFYIDDTFLIKILHKIMLKKGKFIKYLVFFLKIGISKYLSFELLKKNIFIKKKGFFIFTTKYNVKKGDYCKKFNISNTNRIIIKTKYKKTNFKLIILKIKNIFNEKRNNRIKSLLFSSMSIYYFFFKIFLLFNKNKKKISFFKINYDEKKKNFEINNKKYKFIKKKDCNSTFFQIIISKKTFKQFEKLRKFNLNVFKNKIKSLLFFFHFTKSYHIKTFYHRNNFNIRNYYIICYLNKEKLIFLLIGIKIFVRKKFFKEKKINLIKNGKIVEINRKHYLKLELIGRGGSGKIYKIMDFNKKIFALKITKINYCKIENLHDRINEISICKIFVSNSKIIQIKDADISLENRIIHIIFEYGECDLDYLVKKNEKKAIDKTFLKFIWKQILEAVEIIHNEKIIHGDLKPSNFLFVEKNLKIIDFGIAKFLWKNQTKIKRSFQIGTVNYMSPETILNFPSLKKKKFKILQSADVWSLGCIFFQMVYKKPPFYNLPIYQKIQAIINNVLEISFLPLNINFANDLLKICFEKNPDFRPKISILKKHPFLK
jgi:serine/threonine-protein kinase TTK/MPS1